MQFGGRQRGLACEMFGEKSKEHFRRNQSERGAVMLVALVTLTSLGALALLALLSTKSSLRRNDLDNRNLCALYVARACVASAQHALSEAIPPGTSARGNVWNNFLNNSAYSTHPIIPGAGVRDGQAGYQFSGDSNQYCEVSFSNNPTDSGGATFNSDEELLLRAVGTCNEANVVLNVAVRPVEPFDDGEGRSCPDYAQEAHASDNAGRNDCMGLLEGTEVTVYNTDFGG